MSDPWDREEEQCCKDLGDGVITLQEYNRMMRDISIDRTATAREAAQDAYDRELERW